ncbi:MAG: 50S ribosomal protein L29 [Planctomycetes bacterium]|jgi:large subunit ribosomal protein L29|nr:50S ribosomal protein L29 [Planctomycetota bacterium]MDA8379185.1 50S ribosomal protein L29 [Planctomycetia bacterium]
MATKKKQMLDELRKLDDTQLKAREMELRRNIYDLRVQRVNGALKDTSLFRKNRKEIARICTLSRQRSLPGRTS